VVPHLGDEQRAGLWALCDRLRLYEVVRVDAKDC
jgi:hypothetical protein